MNTHGCMRAYRKGARMRVCLLVYACFLALVKGSLACCCFPPVYCIQPITLHESRLHLTLACLTVHTYPADSVSE